nr:hypothetical protein [Mycobacterium riyadhense]
MTQWMRQAVDDVYRQLSLPEDWSPEHKERYLQTLTSGLDRMAAELADTLGAAAITEWSTRHGQHPDYLTTVRLRETATTTPHRRRAASCPVVSTRPPCTRPSVSWAPHATSRKVGR